MIQRKRKIPIRNLIDSNSISLICKNCNKECNSHAGLSSHINRVHKISYNEYLLDYYKIDIQKLESEYIEYQLNNKDDINKKKVVGLNKYTSSIKGKTKREILGDNRFDDFIESMKGVYSIGWFIEKYGDVEGKVKYDERAKSISKTSHFKIYNKQNKQNWSKISQELFNKIYNIIGNLYDKVYYGELNHEYSCGVSKNNYDFVVLDNKKVIEFNGDKFHANPILYEENDIPLKFLNKTAKEIWKSDKEKIQKAKNNGYDVLIIWEWDYLKDKNKILLECIDFILN